MPGRRACEIGRMTLRLRGINIMADDEDPRGPSILRGIYWETVRKIIGRGGVPIERQDWAKHLAAAEPKEKFMGFIPVGEDGGPDNPFAEAVEWVSRQIEESILLPTLAVREPLLAPLADPDEEVARERREQHRLGIPVGHPVVTCPTDGTVAALEENVDPTFRVWSVKCPLCETLISVGRFDVVLILAYFKRKKLQSQPRAYRFEDVCRVNFLTGDYNKV
jgi:hypothetical protein